MAQKGRKAPPAPNLAKLEKLYGQVGAMLHASNQADQHIGQANVALHDQANEKIAALAKQLEAQYPNVDPELARAYGRLLVQRKKYQQAILRDRAPAWERGPKAGI